MPDITMLDIEELKKTKLRPLIEQCLEHRAPDPAFHAMMGHNPDQAWAMFVAWSTCFNTGRINHTLKEIIRIQLARFAGDSYFGGVRSKQALAAGLDEARIDAGCGDYDDDPRFSKAERVALRYADQMYLDPQKVDAAFYDEMKRHYSEAQIMELGGFIAFHYGMQVFMRTLDARPLAAPAG